MLAPPPALDVTTDNQPIRADLWPTMSRAELEMQHTILLQRISFLHSMLSSRNRTDETSSYIPQALHSLEEGLQALSEIINKQYDSIE